MCDILQFVSFSFYNKRASNQNRAQEIAGYIG